MIATILPFPTLLWALVLLYFPTIGVIYFFLRLFRPKPLWHLIIAILGLTLVVVGWASYNIFGYQLMREAERNFYPGGIVPPWWDFPYLGDLVRVGIPSAVLSLLVLAILVIVDLRRKRGEQ
jgi:hypothetical protein